MEKLKEIDYSLYRVYALGDWGVLKGLIYDPFPVGRCPGEPDETIYGLDFGFNNPSALIRLDVKDGAVYLNESIYERGLTTQALIERMREIGVQEWDPIYADAAEPDRVQEIYDAGFNVFPAAKGQGSVNAGILCVKATKVFTHPGNTNIALENSLYKWKEDINGNVLDEPAKIHDHAMDAIRYGIFTHIGKESDFKAKWL